MVVVDAVRLLLATSMAPPLEMMVPLAAGAAR
jgi:hypothetical protein